MENLYVGKTFELVVEKESVHILVKGNGVTVFEINDVLKKLPQVKVTQFMALQNAIKTPNSELVEIGQLIEDIEIEVSADEMGAFLRINMPQKAIDDSWPLIRQDCLKKIYAKGIAIGIINDALETPPLATKKFKIAEGIQPISGEDAKIRYIELGSKKPKVSEDGQSDYYELDLIHNVKIGDWLGEKIPPTPGKPGATVLGHPIPGRTGRDIRMKYDPKTVSETFENGLFVLRATINGAVTAKQGKISVENHLVIPGNVDYETGNIDFDGNVTIEGTVEDKFKVIATGDIAIKGNQGVGAAERIESKKGSIFIKGGINGKNRALVIAKENIFIKYVNEAHLEAEDAIHVQKYVFDSYVKASKIYVDPSKGKIVGGQVEAKHQIVSGSIGNEQERETLVNIHGFERNNIKGELDAIKLKLADHVASINRMKRKLEIFEENYTKLDERASNTYHALLQNYESMIDELTLIHKRLIKYEDILRTRGEGEIKIHQNVHPKTLLEIKKLQRQVTQCMQCSFYFKEGRIHLVD